MAGMDTIPDGPALTFQQIENDDDEIIVTVDEE